MEKTSTMVSKIKKQISSFSMRITRGLNKPKRKFGSSDDLGNPGE